MSIAGAGSITAADDCSTLSGDPKPGTSPSIDLILQGRGTIPARVQDMTVPTWSFCLSLLPRDKKKQQKRVTSIPRCDHIKAAKLIATNFEGGLREPVFQKIRFA